MIAEKMKGMVANSSAIRAMFEEGNRLAKLYGRGKCNLTSVSAIQMWKHRRR